MMVSIVKPMTQQKYTDTPSLIFAEENQSFGKTHMRNLKPRAVIKSNMYFFISAEFLEYYMQKTSFLSDP